MPSSAILAANLAIRAKMLESGSRVTYADDEDDSSRARCWGGYQYFIPVEKAEYEEELLSVDLCLHFNILQRLMDSFTKYVV